MEITRHIRPDLLELKLKGRMDAIWSEHVSKALSDGIRAGHHTIDLDLAEVPYLSSAGIRVLIQYFKQLKGIGGRLSIAAVSPEVRKVLMMSGVTALMASSERPVEARREPASVQPEAPRAMDRTFEWSVLREGAVMRSRVLGKIEALRQLSGSLEECQSVAFPCHAIGLGLGAFGAEPAECRERFGEFLAVAGAAACLPADGTNKPDYVIAEGTLIPSLQVVYGLYGEGEFASLLRFEGREKETISLSQIADACLQLHPSQTVALALVAETSALVGAALQRSPLSAMPRSEGHDLFHFPEIRDWLGFTAETAFNDSVSLILGMATRQPSGPAAAWFRPLRSAGDIQGHFHAAAFSYRPIRRGKILLTDTVASLFDSQNAQGVLHLLNDWRKVNGVGESRFLRGACWCSPVEWNPY
jgi:anti-anti-sigma factor